MAGERVGALAATIAISVSLFVLTAVVTADVAAYRRLEADKIAGTMVPASGSLLGIRADDGSEWQPLPGERQVGVLFGVADTVQDVEFWKDVALRVNSDAGPVWSCPVSVDRLVS